MTADQWSTLFSGITAVAIVAGFIVQLRLFRQNTKLFRLTLAEHDQLIARNQSAELSVDVETRYGKTYWFLMIRNRGPAAAQNVRYTVSITNPKGARVQWLKHKESEPFDLLSGQVRAEELGEEPPWGVEPVCRLMWTDDRGPQQLDVPLHSWGWVPAP